MDGIAWAFKLIPVLEVCMISKALAKESPCPEFANDNGNGINLHMFPKFRRSVDIRSIVLYLSERKDIDNVHFSC